MYRRIPSDIWGEDWFLDLCHASKVFYFWASTNKHMMACGAVLIGRRTMCFEAGINDEQLTKALTDLSCRISYRDGYLIYPRFIEQNNGGANWIRSVKRESKELPDAIEADLHDAILAVMASEPKHENTILAPMPFEPNSKNGALAPMPSPKKADAIRAKQQKTSLAAMPSGPYMTRQEHDTPKQDTQDPPLIPPSISSVVGALSNHCDPRTRREKTEEKPRVCVKVERMGIEEGEPIGWEGEKEITVDPLEQEGTIEELASAFGAPDAPEPALPPIPPMRPKYHTGDRVQPVAHCEEYLKHEPLIKRIFSAWLKACPQRADSGTQLTSSRCTLIVDSLAHSTEADMVAAIQGYASEAKRRAGEKGWNRHDDLHHILRNRERIEDYIAKGKLGTVADKAPSNGQKEWDWLVNEVIRKANYRNYPDKIRVVNRAVGGISAIREAQDDFALRRVRDAWLAAWRETPDDAKPVVNEELKRAVKAAEEGR